MLGKLLNSDNQTHKFSYVRLEAIIIATHRLFKNNFSFVTILSVSPLIGDNMGRLPSG